MGERAHAYALSAALLGAALLPLLTGRDSFPLSTYPMFAKRRETEVEVNRAVGVRGAERVSLPPEVVASQEVMQAAATLRRALGGGSAAAAALCKDVAGRVARSPAFAGVTGVELVTERWDSVAYFAGKTEPLSSRVRSRCKVQP